MHYSYLERIKYTTTLIIVNNNIDSVNFFLRINMFNQNFFMIFCFLQFFSSIFPYTSNYTQSDSEI